MSNSPQADNVEGGPRPGLPTAMIHKKILDAARNDPRASLTEISNVVSGASVDLVERVLKNYGDPAERLIDETPDRQSDAEPAGSDAESSDAAASESTESPDDAETTSADTVSSDEAQPTPVADEQPAVPDVSDLTETQLETLAAVAEHPQATQRELADVLGVSCATVNRRVSAVEGLSWADRQPFVEALFADRDISAAGVCEAGAGGEEQAAGRSESDESSEECRSAPSLDDPKLVRKVIHACVESDRISADEELEVIGAFVDAH
ncbi:MAG: winged helix-turn-helix transcriptional regulator [Halobellus sp.]|uniref:winged helix-turn-helix transcriptional regulator n=1 Tax=Halobellus sp. TaxID=1979212 RepID=UPI0035D51FA8